MDGYRSLIARKILCMSTILTELFAGNFFTNKMPVNGMHVKFVRLGLDYMCASSSVYTASVSSASVSA